MSAPRTFPAVEPFGEAAQARWPLRLRDLVSQWHDARDPATAVTARECTWTLLYGAVACFVRGRGRSLPSLLANDLPDVAAEKALDLMRQIESRAWDPSQSSPEQVRAYVALAVKHALVDLTRIHDRRSLDRPTVDDHEASAPAAQETAMDGKAYAAGILACLSRLTERNRVAWCLRVLLEMTTEQIARHPSVHMSPGAVDVMLYRVRGAMRRCLAKSALDTAAMPPGTYVHLWEAMDGGEP